MKTQIIQLERHDDVVSVRDKMTWAKTQRILLVWPTQRGRRILTRRLDLLLLQRHSTRSGAQLGIVTRDISVQGHARQLGIPYFSTIQQAQNGIWRRQRARKVRLFKDRLPHSLRDIRPQSVPLDIWPAQASWAQSGWVRIGFFALGLLAFMSLLAALLPRAVVQVRVEPLAQSVQVRINANPGIQSVRLTGEVPAVLLSTIVEARDTVPASGTVNVPAATARGKAVFSNLTNHPIRVPVGTIVTTLGTDLVRYQTLKEVILPKDSEETIEVSIQAFNPGKSGNVPAGSIRAVEGALGLSVTVANPSPIRGGSDQSSPAPTERDLSTIHKRLENKLQLAALADFKEQLTAGDRLAAETIELKQIIRETQDTQLHQSADHLTVSIQAEYTIWVVRRDSIDELGMGVLNASLGEDFSAMESTYQATDLTTPNLTDENLVWTVRFERQTRQNFPDSALAAQIASKPTWKALQVIAATIKTDNTPEINLTPSWWPWMPMIPGRISIVSEVVLP